MTHFRRLLEFVRIARPFLAAGALWHCGTARPGGQDGAPDDVLLPAPDALDASDASAAFDVADRAPPVDIVDVSEDTPQGMPESLVVDVGNTHGPVSGRASGFLFGLSDAAPSDDLLDPLAPHLFRTAGFYNMQLHPYARMHVRAPVVFVIGLTADAIPGDNGDWTAWDAKVRGAVDAADQAGESYLWDVWNEPDLTAWPSNPWPDARYLEAWRRAVVTIRGVHPDATIVGPSTSVYNLTALQTFLNFASENGVLPDVMSWHEFGPWLGLDAPDRIPAHVDAIRQYTQGTIQRFQINEWMGLDQRYDPAVALWFFANLERAGVESAERSCWNDECFDTSLGGILTPSHARRSIWWAHRVYGSLAGQMVDVAPTANLDGVASATPMSVRAGFGNHGQSRVAPTLSLVGLPAAMSACVHVVADLIPDTEADVLAAPTRSLDENRLPSAGSVTLALPTLAPGDAWDVALSPCP